MERAKRCSMDRLSELPDCILCHILSFLPTKLCLATSILSPRWRFLWTWIPNPDFEVGCKIGDIQRYLLTCNTVVVLTVRDSVRLPLISDVRLPCLKKLHLYRVEYDDDNALQTLLSGCRVLEELVIGILNQDRVRCLISSPTIKKLTLPCLYPDDGGIGYSHDSMVEINAPALRYLEVHDQSEHIKAAGPFNFLSEADICLDNECEKQDDILYSRSVLGFINRLSNVKCLKLDLALRTEVADSVFSTAWTTKFQNLTKLELIAECRYLSKFLEIANNLEILSFCWISEDYRSWTEPQQLPTCLSLHLTTITVTDFPCTEERAFEMVRYFLKNAEFLERMNIRSEDYGYVALVSEDKRFGALQRISMYPRVSKICELAFDTPKYY